MSSTAACAASSRAGTRSSGPKGDWGGGGGGEELREGEEEEEELETGDVVDGGVHDAERSNASCGSQLDASQASPTSLEKAPGIALKALTQERSCFFCFLFLFWWWWCFCFCFCCSGEKE